MTGVAQREQECFRGLMGSVITGPCYLGVAAEHKALHILDYNQRRALVVAALVEVVALPAVRRSPV